VNVATLPREILSGEVRADAKVSGAFYTDEAVARFLVRWAVRRRTDKVLDPSFGGGVFLRAAAEKIEQLGGNAADSVFGVELDGETHALVSAELTRRHGLRRDVLVRSDFFAVGLSDIPQMDAVVGNPPFVRYQRFKGEARIRALNRAAEQGVDLPKLSSSWAPFVVHSAAMLERHGRLAMVLPMELGYAAYARPVLAYLARNFSRLHILAFERSLFPKINEETVLLLAEDKKAADGRLAETRLYDLSGAADLESFDPTGDFGTDVGCFIRGQRRLAEFLLPVRTRELYTRLQALGLSSRFGALADVGIGYVSGNNEFFHPRPVAIEEWGLPVRFLRRAVLTGAALQGMAFTEEDWRRGLGTGATGQLLFLKPEQTDLPSAVEAYLSHGRRQKVDQAYKCRARTTWFAVPHVHQADGFLTYMSGAMTRLVANDAGAVAPNTLHVVRLHRGVPLTMPELAARWLTSLSQLSVEIEGHSLGGGMLKLEPTEAERVLIPLGAERTGLTPETTRELDVLLRAAEFDRAREIADDLFLRGELGLSGRECTLLWQAALLLRNRRQNRKKASAP
jgi:adenine-specific DNA methylase